MAGTLETHPEHGTRSSPSTGAPVDTLAIYREALSLWLEWNQAYETVTAQLFANRNDVAAMQELMDRMEDVRRRAVELSRSLMTPAGPAQ